MRVRRTTPNSIRALSFAVVAPSIAAATTQWLSAAATGHHAGNNHPRRSCRGDGSPSVKLTDLTGRRGGCRRDVAVDTARDHHRETQTTNALGVATVEVGFGTARRQNADGRAARVTIPPSSPRRKAGPRANAVLTAAGETVGRGTLCGRSVGESPDAGEIPLVRGDLCHRSGGGSIMVGPRRETPAREVGSWTPAYGHTHASVTGLTERSSPYGTGNRAGHQCSR